MSCKYYEQLLSNLSKIRKSKKDTTQITKQDNYSKTVQNNDKYEEFKGVRFYFLKKNGIHALFVSLG